MQMGQRGATMNIGQLDGQPLALQIFNGMTAESICVNERWAKDQLFRCVCFAGGQIKSTPSIAWRTLCFNPRPPRGGRRTQQRFPLAQSQFQSTSSVWRTTRSGYPPTDIRAFQSTSSVWRTTRSGYPPTDIRAFQSTSSVWRTTWALCVSGLAACNFNPRPPCGGRLV